MSEILTWKKIPSVTTGGKPFFYRAYCGQKWAASVVWNRAVRAYLVDVNRNWMSVPVGYTSTATEGKALAVRALKAKDEKEVKP